MRRRIWAWVRLLGGAGILAFLVWRLGTGAVVDAWRVIDGGTVAVAGGIGVATTVLSAWRWRLVARGLGISLPLGTAVADYYRALFLNAALPGGVLGDVHRAVSHGRDVGDVGRGVRAVALERTAGQVVVVTIAVTVLLLGAAPLAARAGLTTVLPLVLAGLVLAVAVAVALWRRRPVRRATRWARALRTGADELRRGVLARRVWPGVVLSSAAVLAGHLATFVVAARAAGVTAPLGQLLPIMLLALLAMMLPMNVGGWGPREGVAAWAFGAAGLGAGLGLTASVVYGMLALVVSLPGAAVLLVRWLRRTVTASPVTPGARIGVTVPAAAHRAAPPTRTVPDPRSTCAPVPAGAHPGGAALAGTPAGGAALAGATAGVPVAPLPARRRLAAPVGPGRGGTA